MTTAVGDVDAEALWRIWAPLGAWADLRALHLGDRAVEQRLLRIVGDDALQTISPVSLGSRVRIFGALADEPITCSLLEITKDTQTSVFAVRRMESPTALTVGIEWPDNLRNTRLGLAQTSDRKWTLQSVDADEPPALLAGLMGSPQPFRVVAFYPKRPKTCSPLADPRIVWLVRAGMASVLRDQLALCSPLPGGPIGGDAFLVAAFDWSVRAASDRAVAAKLTELCREVAIPLAREARNRLSAPEAKLHDASVRIAAEMEARWPERDDSDPLVAVHLLSWLTAMALVFRGLNWQLPFMWQESQVLETAVALQEMAPKLLEHDITKLCLIEAMVASRARTEEKPESVDGGTECH